MAETERIVVAKPPLGAKAWVMSKRGLFVLEEQPGVFHHDTCTHAGAGSLKIWDGQVVDGRVVGREIFRQNVIAMGVWHLSAGFQHGLVVENVGRGNDTMSAIATMVWQTKADATTLSLGPRRSVRLEPGRQVICSMDCLLYSVLISKAGNGQVQVKDGTGARLYECPSLFAGSFLLEHVFARGGLLVELNAPVTAEIEVAYSPILQLAPEPKGTPDGR